jgi:2-polyprenyl-3-methyl-5-hydroxy-6-metoxy-1,4-benzoquinol methylase
MDSSSEAKIIHSWCKNVFPWIVAVREGQIESRKLITDREIISAILSRSPRSVLDLGCGEGWLVRTLATHKIQVIGVDVVPELIEQAKISGGADFYVASYEEIARGKLNISVDVIVCNFSLFGKESVEELFKIIPSLLNARGSFIVQTLHPMLVGGGKSDRDGWREGSWIGFSSEFTEPFPWYFRTTESWIELFQDNRFRSIEIREPIHPKTHKPASVIFIAEATG